MTTITTTAPTIQELNAIAIERIIEQAKLLARHPDLDKWKHVYEPAKWAIAKFTTSASEYESAIARLSEALGI